MIYTVARAAHGVVIIGSVPQYELNALINVWQQEFGTSCKLARDIAKKLGYVAVIGPQDSLDQWREELGMVGETEDESEESREAPEAVG